MYGNSKIEVLQFEEKGRGLITKVAIEADELILRSPVTVLDGLEYRMLRLLPALRAFADGEGFPVRDNPDAALFFALENLVNDPEKVLRTDQTVTSASSAIMYTFAWDRSEEEGGPTSAIAFGAASLCNHIDDAALANAKTVQQNEINAIDLVATTNIEAGKEILIQYNSVPFTTS